MAIYAISSYFFFAATADDDDAAATDSAEIEQFLSLGMASLERIAAGVTSQKYTLLNAYFV
jgi:hypothetical protein